MIYGFTEKDYEQNWLNIYLFFFIYLETDILVRLKKPVSQF